MGEVAMFLFMRNQRRILGIAGMILSEITRSCKPLDFEISGELWKTCLRLLGHVTSLRLSQYQSRLHYSLCLYLLPELTFRRTSHGAVHGSPMYYMGTPNLKSPLTLWESVDILIHLASSRDDRKTKRMMMMMMMMMNTEKDGRHL